MFQPKHALLSFCLLAAAGSGLAAETLYIPCPDYGPGKALTKIQIRNGVSNRRTLRTSFIPTGQQGSSLAARDTVFPAAKDYIFLATSQVAGPGLLKLEVPADLSVVEAAVFLEPVGQSTNWELPILSPANVFQPGETAYLQGLERNAKVTSRLEIVNLGAAAASCTVRTRQREGAEIATRTESALLPVSHRAVAGILDTPGLAAVVSGVRAEVACDQPFYAYATARTASQLDLRIMYPLDGPPLAYSETVRVQRGGTFLAGSPAKPYVDVTVPLPRNVAYRRATLEFDMAIGPFSPVFTGLVGMYHLGGPRFNKTLYFGTFFRGDRKRLMIDQGSPVLEPAAKINSTLTQGGTYKIRIVYDAEAARITFQALKNSQVVFEAQGGAFNLDLADRGAPITVRFGLPGIADSAYFPPDGWKFSNLTIEFAR